MSKSNTLFQHPVYIAMNAINDLDVKYIDYDEESLCIEEIDEDIEAWECLFSNCDWLIKKTEYQDTLRNMQNAIDAVKEYNTREMRGTDY